MYKGNHGAGRKPGSSRTGIGTTAIDVLLENHVILCSPNSEL